MANMIDFETFTYTFDGTTFDVKFCKKDYTATYNSKFGPLSYGTHIMFCCPKIYTKEEIISRIETSVCRILKNCENYISNNRDKLIDFISNLKKVCVSQSDELILLQSQKSELKKQFKNGVIPEKEYQILLKPIKNQINTIKSNPRENIEIFTKTILHENYDLINVMTTYLQKVYNHPELLSTRSIS